MGGKVANKRFLMAESFRKSDNLFEKFKEEGPDKSKADCRSLDPKLHGVYREALVANTYFPSTTRCVIIFPPQHHEQSAVQNIRNKPFSSKLDYCSM